MAKHGDKNRNNGSWSDARFRTFITSLLRSGTQRWGPMQKCKTDARVARGLYECAICKEHVPTTVYDEEKRKRVHNIAIDHVDPVVDPAVGFTTWDEYIERMYVEIDGFQLLCNKCHTIKTNEERRIAKERRSNND